jgi:hypothetical protein
MWFRKKDVDGDLDHEPRFQPPVILNLPWQVKNPRLPLG